MTRAVSPLDVSPTQSSGSAVAASAGATVVHVALVALSVLVGAQVTRKVAQAPTVTQLVEVELPHEIVEPPSAPSPAAISKPIQHNVRPAPPVQQRSAPPAGQVLTAADDEVDFGEPFVESKGSGYEGGETTSSDVPTPAVRGAAANGSGVPVAAVAPPVIDRSRGAQLAGGSAWDCPFPIEADDAGVDHAVVSLRIEVAADGHVLSASATRDPGHGFAREARRCALSKRWSAGLDRAGQPTVSTTVVNVRFDR